MISFYHSITELAFGLVEIIVLQQFWKMSCHFCRGWTQLRMSRMLFAPLTDINAHEQTIVCRQLSADTRGGLSANGKEEKNALTNDNGIYFAQCTTECSFPCITISTISLQ